LRGSAVRISAGSAAPRAPVSLGSSYGKTVSVKLTLDVAPFGAVAVTTSG
jgi:hypothetical protein